MPSLITDLISPAAHGAAAGAPERCDPRRVGLAAGLSAVIAIALFVLADAHALPHFVYDDGGITLRYAERVAQGSGFTYNDGERVNGCSDPLYTLVLALFLRAGAAPTAAVQMLGALAYALTAGVLVYTLTRHYSLLAALVAFAILAGNEFAFYSMFNGLETPLTVLLGALLFSSLHTRSEWLTGTVLGLLVANKLDGGLAALAYALTSVVLARRFPWRAAVAASIAFLPMAAWLLASFGSVLPNSMLVKLATATPGRLSHAWVLGKLRWNAYWPLVFSMSAVLVPVLRRGERLIPTVAIASWAALHVAVYSFVDLGGPYPWYAAPLVVLLAILAGVGLDALAAVLARALAFAWKRRARASTRDAALLATRANAVTVAAGSAAALLFVPALLLPSAAGVLPLYRGGSAPVERVPRAELARDDRAARPALAPYACGDLARLAAGAWLRRYGGPGEVLETSFGLPAFAYVGPVYDSSELNSAPSSPLLARAVYSIREGEEPPPGADWELVALFRFPAGSESDAEPASKSNPYRVYALPHSRVRRDQRSFGLEGRTDAPLDADELRLLSRAWREYASRVLAENPRASVEDTDSSPRGTGSYDGELRDH